MTTNLIQTIKLYIHAFIHLSSYLSFLCKIVFAFFDSFANITNTCKYLSIHIHLFYTLLTIHFFIPYLLFNLLSLLTIHFFITYLLFTFFIPYLLFTFFVDVINLFHPNSANCKKSSIFSQFPSGYLSIHFPYFPSDYLSI